LDMDEAIFWTLHGIAVASVTCAKSADDPKHAAIDVRLRARRWLDYYVQVEDFQWLSTPTRRRLLQASRLENRKS